MILLTADRLSYSLPGRELLTDISLGLEKGEKVGLIGRNGTGKSTLLQLLTGRLVPESGQVTLRGQTVLRLLEQLPTLEGEEGYPLREVVTRGCPELCKLRQRYDKVCQQLESGGSPTLEKELNHLTDQLTHHDAWDLETRAATLLTMVGLTDPDRPLAGLSGGEQKRVALARTLLVAPDILLLDEPTNHLDIATITWLERFLMSAPFSVLMVTHDRYFLERVCTRIVEIAHGSTYSYSGNYSSFLEQKAEREAGQVRQQERFDNILRQEQAWLRQGAKARSTKQKARKERAQAMIEGGSGIPTAEQQTEDAAWNLGTRRLGRKVVTWQGVSARILKPLDLRIEPGERLGLVGANGSGKTTFLELLAGRLEPETGNIETGETVHVGYFDQHTETLHRLPPETRALEAVRDVATSIPLSNGKEVSASRLCEMFLFSGRGQATPLEKLSGGEKKRLELLRLLIDRPNFILLDEPTNDLDIDTLQRLEYFLDGFPGCLCIASHDRFLLQRLCDRILIFRDGFVEEVLPEALDDIGPGFFEKKVTVISRSAPASPSAPPTEAKKRKLSYKETTELSTLESLIPELEERLARLDTELATPALSYAKVQELYSDKETTERRLELSVERWAELEELREALQG